MAEIEIKASQWRLVEVGRVVLFTHGQYTGRLAAIVEIIDHRRVSLEDRAWFPSLGLTFRIGIGRRTIQERKVSCPSWIRRTEQPYHHPYCH